MKDIQQLNERNLLKHFVIAQVMHLEQYCHFLCCYVGCMIISSFMAEFLLKNL